MRSGCTTGNRVSSVWLSISVLPPKKFQRKLKSPLSSLSLFTYVIHMGKSKCVAVFQSFQSDVLVHIICSQGHNLSECFRFWDNYFCNL